MIYPMTNHTTVSVNRARGILYGCFIASKNTNRYVSQ